MSKAIVERAIEIIQSGDFPAKGYDREKIEAKVAEGLVEGDSMVHGSQRAVYAGGSTVRMEDAESGDEIHTVEVSREQLDAILAHVAANRGFVGSQRGEMG